MSACKYYFDESVELAVSTQLQAQGFDVVSVHSLGTLGETDIVHLQKATEMGRILCTYDSDFLRLAVAGHDHAGIVYAPRQKIGIGGWIRGIRALHGSLDAEDAINQVFYLP